MPAEGDQKKPEDRKSRDTALHRAWRNWGDHPAVAILAVLGSLATIVSVLKPDAENKSPVSAEAPSNEPAPSQPNGGVQQADLTPGTRLPKSKSEPRESSCADVAGRWDWLTTGGVVAIAETGTMNWYRLATDPLPTVFGTWECSRANPRHLTFRWNTGMVDTMVLSRDGQRFTGANMATGFRLSGTRAR